MYNSIENCKAAQREALELQNSIQDAISAQKREMTAEEKASFDAATAKFETAAREITAISQAAEYEKVARENAKSVSKSDVLKEAVREAQRTGKKDINLSREILQFAPNSGNNYLNERATALTIKDIVDPLELPTIYNKVGIAIETGVRGNLEWPCLDTKATVAVKGEAVALTDTDINFSGIIAKPVRLGISVAVTNEALDNAAYDLHAKVNEMIGKSLVRVFDEAIFKSSAFDTDFYGPFATTGVAKYQTSAATPTFADLMAMKGMVMAQGADMVGFAYVMNPTTYAAIEATPITSGDSRMILENGKIGGYPVYLVKAATLADGYVGAGCFGYVALNQHGDAHLIVDPYTNSLKNEVVFTLNADWSLTVLKENAFVLGYTTATTAAASREHRADK